MSRKIIEDPILSYLPKVLHQVLDFEFNLTIFLSVVDKQITRLCKELSLDGLEKGLLIARAKNRIKNAVNPPNNITFCNIREALIYQHSVEEHGCKYEYESLAMVLYDHRHFFGSLFGRPTTALKEFLKQYGTEMGVIPTISPDTPDFGRR